MTGMEQTADTAGPNITRIATLLADPVRARIIWSLIDGRALTAGELAHAGGVSPQTASSHLAKLIDGKLLDVARQGRHRYYRINGPEAAHLIETLSVLAEQPQARLIYPRAYLGPARLVLNTAGRRPPHFFLGPATVGAAR